MIDLNQEVSYLINTVIYLTLIYLISGIDSLILNVLQNMSIDDFLEALPNNHPIKEGARLAFIEYTNLKKKAQSGKVLYFDEVKRLCNCLENHVFDQENINIYSCCEDYIFWSLYLTYYKNLAGGIQYFKQDRNKVRHYTELQLKTTGKVDLDLLDISLTVSQVSYSEVERDLNHLYQISDNWKKVIFANNDKNKVLKEACNEAKQALSDLEKSVVNIPFEKGKFTYKRKERGIILRSKYVYILARDVINTTNIADLTINIFGQDIEIDEYSIVHIVSRHFAAASHQYFIDKTYHTTDVNPKQIHVLLKNTFTIINAATASIHTAISTYKILFDYKGILYVIYTAEKKRMVKNIGLQHYRRLNTFFPASIEKRNEEMSKGYQKLNINGEISIYIVPRTK